MNQNVVHSGTIRCMQCDEDLVLNRRKLYCCIACEQEAELVRYVRRCSADGRVDDEEVRAAVDIRLAHIAAGGYDKKSRRIPLETRSEIFVRAGGFCVKCGQPGDEIDHIDGPSPAPHNLQLLCHSCHNVKTNERIVAVTPDSLNFDELKSFYENFWTSVRSDTPLRPCHDEVGWASAWRGYLKQRKDIAG